MKVSQNGEGFWTCQNEEEIRGSVLASNLHSVVEEGTTVIPSSNQCNGIVKFAGPSARVANRPLETCPKKSLTVELRHPIETNHQPPSSSIQNDFVPNKERHVHNSSRSIELHEVRSEEKAIEPVSKDTYQTCSGHIPDNNLETFDTSLNNLSFWDSLRKENLSATSNMDIQTLMEVEELQDKELEEAQEHRRKCEVEERNSLKAYRKAQRAMMEANSRCSYLYRKRELYSANFRSLMMDNPSMFWSSRPHDHLGTVPNSSNNMPEVNMHVGTSNHQMESDLYAHNQCRYNSNVRSGNVALQNLCDQQEDQHEDDQDLASNPCSEPDASTSDPQKDNAEANVACSQSSDLNMSVDEGDETFPVDHEADEGNLDHQKKEEKYNEKQKHVYDDLRTLDSSQDSLLLEASLRSQLFARLGIKNPLNDRRPGQCSEPATESSAQDDCDDKVKTSMVNLTLSEAEKDQPFDLRGSEREERTISELPVQIKNKYHVEKFCSNYGSPTTDPLNNCFSTEGHHSVRSISFLYPVMRSTFGHMKVVDMISLVQSHTRCQNIHPFYVYDQTSNGVGHYGIKSISMEDTSMDTCFSEVGSYSCYPEIDPLWPLCIFELRGKCNDDECTRQHVRNYSHRNMKNGNATDDQDMASSLGVKSSGATSVSRSLDLLGIAPPSYLVCADILKADLYPYKSILAQTEGRCWQKRFSAALVLSSLLPTSSPSDEPFLHGPGARIESYGSWNRQSSFFHSRHGTMSQLNQHLIDNDESLEVALLSFSQEVNKQKGRIEALKVLARSLETDPKSAVLWIVYLHIYYSNQKSLGKDDMFNYAVEHNEESYELWLMYINSREQLDDRLVAYDNALSALSLHASSPGRDAMHSSECILDLFLQMIHTLCISGKVDKAIDKIYRFPSRKKSDEPHGLFLTDVLTCLSIWDKCIFWVCCVYLVVYKKLPDAVVLQFECQKQFSSIEWVSTHLTVDEKQQAVNLMEMAVDSLALYIDGELLESETTLKAAHMFALNHVRCIAVLESLECSRNLLEKYIKLYPFCLELVLMAARAHELEFSNWSFVGFEEALSNWLEEVPGVQCIWNQYAEYALQNGRCNFVKELMDRWFHSVWKVQGSQHNILDNMDGENSFGLPDPDALICTSSKIDVTFGLLNLSLYKLLQNDHIEAHSATGRALKCASAENYKHCVREHAMFWLTDGSRSKDAPVREVLKILNQYLVDTWALPATELLSRKFIQAIKKPRVQQLVSNLFSPVSVDFSLVNLVLEVWYGPSLLPVVYDKETDLVDLVEAIMEILPANYQLAISLCKLLSKTSSSATVTSSISFWASSILVNALFQTVPVAPEYIWVEAASVLHNLTDIQSISMSFHKRALSVYPFSMKLWESYLNISRITGDGNAVIEAARSRGIELY